MAEWGRIERGAGGLLVAVSLKEERMRKVLIVEDEPQMQAFFRQSVLSQQPCELKVCENGDEAACLLDAELFDLMITDLRHPGLFGFDLVKRARQDVRHAQMRILVVSGFLELPSTCGADVYMEKQTLFDRKLFAHVVAGLLGRRIGAEVETPEAVQIRLADILAYAQGNHRICPEGSSWSRLVNMLPNCPEDAAVLPELPPPAHVPLLFTMLVDKSAQEKLQRLLCHAATEGVLKHVDRFLRALPESDWRHATA